MKRTLLAAASMLALAAGSAQAQSSVTLFGLVDTGVEYIDNIGPEGDSVVRMPTLAGSFASRWGVRGTEDLGGGLKANFILESGFGADSGVFQQGNRMFGRQLYVGLSGNWGAVTLGRLYSQLLWTQIKTDPFMASVYGPGAFDTFLAGPRLDNAIAYNHKIGGLSFGAQYSLGRDNNGSASPGCAGEAAGDSSNCRAWSANLIYEGAGWGVGGYLDEQNNALGETDERHSINGYFTLGKTKLMANYLVRDNENTVTVTPAPSGESTLWSLGVSHPVTDKITFEAAYYDYDIDETDNDASMIVLRGSYAFSKRTATYLYLGHMMNDGNSALSASIGVLPSTSLPDLGEDQTAVMIGLRHSF
jgi:predicted porin